MHSAEQQSHPRDAEYDVFNYLTLTQIKELPIGTACIAQLWPASLTGQHPAAVPKQTRCPGVVEIGPARKIFAFQAGEIDQQFLTGLPESGEIVMD